MSKSKYPRLVRSSVTRLYENNTVFHLYGCHHKEEWEVAYPYLQTHVDHEGDAVPAVRVYKSSPDEVTVQIRTYGPVGRTPFGKPRAVYSQFSSNRQGMLALAAEIKRIAESMEEA